MKKHIITFLFLLFTVFLPNKNIHAQIKPINSHNLKEKVHIISDKLVIYDSKNFAVFTGNVKVTQKGVQIFSEEIIVIFESEGEKKVNNKKSVKKIISDKPIKIVAKDQEGIKKASADKGIFEVEKEFITLSNNVVLEENKSVLNGQQFTYDLKSGKSKLSGKAKGTSFENKNTKPSRVKGSLRRRK